MTDTAGGPRAAGEEFGALQLRQLSELYGDQADAARRILEEVYRIASRSFHDRSGRHRVEPPVRHESRYAAARTSSAIGAAAAGSTRLDAPIGSDPADFRRPHHVLTIDGNRGTGKTSVLLTLIPYLDALTLGRGRAFAEMLEPFLARDLETLDLPIIDVPHRSERVALVLPIVFTEDMEPQESTMEAVFALMEQLLDEHERATANDADKKRTLHGLRRDLRDKIGVGWTYSRKIGAETLPIDALNYSDFVNKRADVSRNAYTRLSTWRRFVDQYLDTLNYATLVLLFDDSDLNANLAEDLIRAIRMYLNHPRIVCLLAVDVSTLERTLLARNLEFYKILDSRGGRAIEKFANSIVEMEEENTGALLEKVLPTPMRHRLALSGMSHVDHLFEPEAPPQDDDSSAAARNSFERWCRSRFLRAPKREQALAWWFLNGPYRRMIAGNLREVVAFRNVARNPTIPALDAVLKRLGPGELSAKSDFKLSNIPALIESGVLVGDDADPVYGRGGSTSSLSDEEERFVDFWADTGLAAAYLDPGETPSASLSWIEAVVPTYNPQRSELRDDGVPLGVADLVEGELLPRNCLYMCHYRHLKPAVGADLPDPSPLSAGLAALDDDNICVDEDEDPDITRTARRLLGDRELSRGPDDASRFIHRLLDRSFVKSERELSDQRLHQIALDVVVLLFACSRGARGRRAAYPAFKKALEELATNETPPDRQDPLREFARSVRRSVCNFERRRQETVFTWACANEIAAVGDDNTQLEVQAIREGLAEWARPTRSQKTLSPMQTRMRILARRSEGLADKPRHALLLAWSLVPLVDTLYDYGSDYQRTATKDDWSRLQAFFTRALGSFAGDSVADRAWLFPDFDDRTLQAVIADVRRAADALTIVDLNDAAGSVGGDSKNLWDLTPRRRLARLLCTSERWVRTNLGIQT